MLPRPNFENAWSAFQKVNMKPSLVGNLIGGKVKYNFDIGAFENACTIRLSYVLNSCDCDIARSPDISTVSGADGSWYMYRIRDALQFLEREWGRPDVVLNGPPIAQSGLAYKKGILMFEAKFSDASGHATLWDGKQCSDHDYFDEATRCSLWILPSRTR
jgi:hypothetical protein